MITIDPEAPFHHNFACRDTPQWFEDDDGAERLSFYYVDFSTTDKEIADWVEHNFPATHCQHEYDCCGRLYADRPKYWRIPHTERLVVFQSFRRNI